MWSNFPEGGAGTNLKKLLHIILDNLLIFMAKKNLTKFLEKRDISVKTRG